MRGRIVIWLAVALLACEESFDPRGTAEPRLVLYAILSPSTDTVLVRVQTTYDPPTSDPLSHTTEPTLTTTSQLLWSSGSAALTDSLVPHPNAARYSSDLHVLTGTPLRVQRGQAYTVRVDAPGYPRAEATTQVPGAAPFSFRNEDVFIHPSDYADLDIDLQITLPTDAFGYWPRLFLEYAVLSSDTTLERIEVPSKLQVSVNGIDPEYPDLQGASTSGQRTVASLEIFTFEGDAYRYAVAQVFDRYGSANVRFQRVVLYLTLFDEHLYKYYFIVHGFFDPYSVRTDEPDYSNVLDGAGVIGSFTLDSLRVTLPSAFP